ncbi:MAG: hypothetical protein HQL31_10975, partial [Planctomycetes bacterium]|nr:hypothetical protein [Planctomycetota bacterium]
LNPSLTSEFLLDSLVYHILGCNIMDGKSRFEHALEKKVTAENFSLRDHPHDTELNSCTAFSGEGVPTRPMALLEKGVLKAHLDSVYSARRRGTTPTGNGSGPFAPILEPGPSTLDTLRASSSIIIEPSRFSGNIDPLTGDFSGVAKGAQLYKNGKHAGPVTEVMIAGNVFEMLSGELLFGDRQYTDGGCYRLPYVVVDGVSVTAG